jgi:hypothetical protein
MLGRRDWAILAEVVKGMKYRRLKIIGSMAK